MATMEAPKNGVTTLAIPVRSIPSGRNTHCAAAYISFLLCDMAGCYSLSVRDQILVRRWATYWSPLVSLHPVAAAGDSLPHFIVDLMQDLALRPVSECLQTEQLRRLDATRRPCSLTRSASS